MTDDEIGPKPSHFEARLIAERLFITALGFTQFEWEGADRFGGGSYQESLETPTHFAWRLRGTAMPGVGQRGERLPVDCYFVNRCAVAIRFDPMGVLPTTVIFPQPIPIEGFHEWMVRNHGSVSEQAAALARSK